MGGHGGGKLVSQPSMAVVKRQKCEHRCLKTFDVVGLFGSPTAGVSLASLGVGRGGPFGCEVGLDLGDGGRWSPDAPRKHPPPHLLLHQPELSGRFHAAGNSGVARREEFPVRWHGERCTVWRTDGAG